METIVAGGATLGEWSESIVSTSRSATVAPVRSAWQRIRHANSFRVLSGAAGILGLLWLVVVAAPPWFVDDQSLDGLKAQNEVRGTLLQGLGGAVLLLGAYFAYQQLRVAQEGQITERYTRAIDQLGHKAVDVRLGGVYALERIARDSPGDQRTVGEVLTALVRTRAPLKSRAGQDDWSGRDEPMPELQERAPDVQASLVVLGRGGFSSLDDFRHNLRSLDLRRAMLSRASLERALLMFTHLEYAILSFAELGDADLSGAHLELAFLSFTHLEGAKLNYAHLDDADLSGARLWYAELQGASLVGADLTRTDLRFANVKGADFSFAKLEGADLRGTHAGEAYGKRTIWPAGFDPTAMGVVMD